MTSTALPCPHRISAPFSPALIRFTRLRVSSQLHGVLDTQVSESRLAHSIHLPQLNPRAPMCPIGWLGGRAAPPDCLTSLQIVLKSRPGIQPEGAGATEAPQKLRNLLDTSSNNIIQAWHLESARRRLSRRVFHWRDGSRERRPHRAFYSSLSLGLFSRHFHLEACASRCRCTAGKIG